MLMLTGQCALAIRIDYRRVRTQGDPADARSIRIRTSRVSIPCWIGPTREDRVLVKASLNLADTFNPELLYYHAGNRTQIGTNLTTPIGRTPSRIWNGRAACDRT